MNKNRSKLLSGLLAVSLVAAMALPAAAALSKRTLEADSGVRLYAGDRGAVAAADAKGNPVDIFAVNGTTYLPARAVAGLTDQTVAYDGATATVYLAGDTSDPKDAEYLDVYFDIAPFSGAVSRADFDAALMKLGGEKTAAEDTSDGLTVAAAVRAAVGAAGMNELALTYARNDSKKANERLAAYGVAGIDGAYAPYVAAALDCDLAFAGWKFNGSLDAATATTLLMNAAEISGQARNYLGNASDPDIYQKLQGAFRSFAPPKDAKLEDLGAAMLMDGVVTGYNLKYDGYNANFLSKYTMTYVNSDIIHAEQLIALMNAAGLDAKIQLEPKSSMWLNTDYEDKTDAEAQQGGVEVVGSSGNKKDYYGLVVSALEFDMQLEFDSVADKESFDAIVEEYAKKYKVNQNEDGSFTPALIRNSEWHPVYFSTTPVSKGGFQHIKDNVIRNGAYSIHPFSMADETGPIAKAVKAAAPDLSVELVDLYVNAAFYRYLTASGED